MDKKEVPNWLLEKQNINIKNSSDTFIEKNLVSLICVLKKLKKNVSSDYGNPVLKTAFLLLFIILICLSKNMSFLFICLAISLVSTAFFSPQKIKRIISAVLFSSVFSFLILLPSVFLNHYQSVITITLKVALNIFFISMFNETTSPNSLTGALKSFFVPNIVIHLFDTTFKYIFILSNTCSEMLLALKTRIIGKRNKKNKAYSGVLAMCFIKSKEMAYESENAMECRGFDGKYKKRYNKKLSKQDLPIIIALIIVIISFIYLEIII